MLLYSRRPSSAQVSFAGGLGLGVADVQDAEEVEMEVDALLVVQMIGNAVMVAVVVWVVIASV